MGVAGVVGGQVAHDLQAEAVRRGHELLQRGVPAQQGIDRGEAGGVVAVVARGREERRQVQHVDAEVDEVLQTLLDAGEVAAVQLPRCVRPGVLHRRGVPVSRHGPVGQRAVVLPGAGEAVGKDLVHDAVHGPAGCRRVRAHHEVRGVGDVVGVRAGRVDPAVPRAPGTVVQQPPVVRQPVPDGDGGAVPDVVVVGAVHDRLDVAGLTVVHLAHVHRAHRRRAAALVRHPQQDVHLVPESRPREPRTVQRRTVVVRLGRQAPTRRAVRASPAHPLTPPAVMPPTMKRCR